jgi:hypothetical protein
MVPTILSSESEMGRKEILLFSKIEELNYLKTVVTSHEIMSQCNSEIKYLRLLRLTRSKHVKIKGQYCVDQFFQDQGSSTLICNLYLHIFHVSMLSLGFEMLIEKDQIFGWTTEFCIMTVYLAITAFLVKPGPHLFHPAVVPKVSRMTFGIFL